MATVWGSKGCLETVLPDGPTSRGASTSWWVCLVLQGVSCMGPPVGRRMHDSDQWEDRCFLVCPDELKRRVNARAVGSPITRRFEKLPKCGISRLIPSADSEEISSSGSTGVMQQLICRFTPEGSSNPGERGDVMYIAFGVAFAMIVIAPFFGRWRASMWLKKHVPAERSVERIPKTA